MSVLYISSDITYIVNAYSRSYNLLKLGLTQGGVNHETVQKEYSFRLETLLKSVIAGDLTNERTLQLAEEEIRKIMLSENYKVK